MIGLHLPALRSAGISADQRVPAVNVREIVRVGSKMSKVTFLNFGEKRR